MQATLIGLTAILMWSLLAALTVATGRVPPFQLAAITFAIGACVGPLTWIFRRRGCSRAAAAAGRLARRRRRAVRLSRAVFSVAAARAAGRGRPRQLPLAAVDRAVLSVPAGRTADARITSSARCSGSSARSCCFWAAACRDLTGNTRRDSSPRSSRPSSGRSTRCSRGGLRMCRPMRWPASAPQRRCSPLRAM